MVKATNGGKLVVWKLAFLPPVVALIWEFLVVENIELQGELRLMGRGYSDYCKSTIFGCYQGSNFPAHVRISVPREVLGHSRCFFFNPQILVNMEYSMRFLSRLDQTLEALVGQSTAIK